MSATAQSVFKNT